MVVGKLVQSAALGVKQTLTGAGMLGDSYTPEEFRSACREYVSTRGQLRSLARYEQPKDVFWDDQNYRGEAYAAFAWAVYVAEVTVDLATYAVSVDDFVALQEVGKVLNPVLAKGQIAGGVAQGIGFALYEKVEWRDGRMQNGQMTNYIMPTSADLPPIRIFFEEMGNAYGAYGAKGIGELPMDGPAPAVVNAVVDALGIPFDSIPLLPENIFEAVNASSRAGGCPFGGTSVMTGKQCDRRAFSLTVNGEPKTVLAHPMERLLDVLREHLGLTGTKEGCGEGECGACAVLMDGALVDSCLVPVLQARGSNVVTIESLSGDPRSSALQDAFLECGGAQCGICTPGMILAAKYLLDRNPQPTLRGNPRRAFGKSLPLHRLHPDFRGRRRSGEARGLRMRFRSGGLRTGRAGQFAGGPLAFGGGARPMAPDRRRHGRDGAVRGGRASGPKAREHLEPPRSAPHGEFFRTKFRLARAVRTPISANTKW